MLNHKDLLQKLNSEIKTEYGKDLLKVNVILEESRYMKSTFGRFAFTVADKLLFYSKLEKEFSKNYYKKNSIDNLRVTNSQLFDELKEVNYKVSFANPEYTTEVFGTELGAMFASYYTSVRSCLNFALEH